MEETDLLVIGAGPCGLAAGIAAKQAGHSLRAAGPADDRLHHRPVPARHDVLLDARADRDRRRAVHREPREAHAAGRDALLPPRRGVITSSTCGRPKDVTDVVRQHRRPISGSRSPGRTTGRPISRDAVVFATGYYDNPNYMGVPGEDLPARRPLLRRGPSVLAPAGDRDRGGEQQRGRGAGVLAGGRRGDAWCTSATGSTGRSRPGCCRTSPTASSRAASRSAGGHVSARSRRRMSRWSRRRRARRNGSRPMPCWP